jgi:hypothetical protein
VTIALARIAAATGLGLDRVAEDLHDVRDTVFGDSVPDEVGRAYVADVNRGRKRHEALVSAFEGHKEAIMQEGRARYAEVFDKVFEQRLPARSRYRRKGLNGIERAQEQEARLEALTAAQEALDTYLRKTHYDEPFEHWTQGRSGRQAAAAIEAALDAEAVAA